jgi:uncharacterized membrane protein
MMKQLLVALTFAGLVGLIGCSNATTGGNAAGTGTFKIKPSEGNVMAVEVKHDAEKAVTLTVEKKGDFKEDISLSASVSPSDKGVTTSISPATIKKGETATATLTVKANKEAAEGDYTVTVTGKPTNGSESTTEVKVKVPKKS